MKTNKNIKIIILILFTVIFISHAITYAHGNPFGHKHKTVAKSRKTHRYPVFIRRILDKIIPYQRRLNQKLSELTQEMKEKKSLKPVLLIMLFSFLYGFIHGIGPGHGKTITFSYFLSKRGTIANGIVMGSLMGLMHAGSALVMVMILYFIIKRTFFAAFENVSYYIKLFSYSVICAIGLFLFIKSLLSFGKEHEHKVTDAKPTTMRDMIPLVLAVGIVPCPGAVIILLFSISQSVIGIGLLSVLFMGCGMATAISLVGVTTISAKKGFLKVFSHHSKIVLIGKTALEVSGSLIIILFGLLFLLAEI